MKRNIYREFIHPEDEAARQQLEAIPGFPTLVKKFMAIGVERLLHGMSMATKLRISETQMPWLYERLKLICGKLQIEIPEFYLEMNPVPNAYTQGDTKLFITVTSGLLEHMDEDEIDAVLAHECGHIVCRHVLYRTIAGILTSGISDFRLKLGSFALAPVQLALLYWYRRSELSADRCAVITCGSVNPMVESLLRLTAGSKKITEKINLEEFMAQGKYYDELLESTYDKILVKSQTMYHTHPLSVVRVNELKKWEKTEQYQKLSYLLKQKDVDSICPNCLQKVEKSWKFCKNCGFKL